TFTVTNKSEREQGWQHRNDLVKQSKHSATKGGVTAKEDNVASKPDSAETKSASTEEDAAPLPKNETHTQTAILSANKIVVDG
ncbi:hypothetical protein, partial [Salmonella enterica]|uniref:hypothetical protein n=1 Tax=Salmonella enterica TaxID=28901 RepID=UPI003D2AB2AC